jgi:hypothetical protein
MSESQLQSDYVRLCKCVSCGAVSHQTKYKLVQLAPRVRCLHCGGNVVESRYAEPQAVPLRRAR